MRREIPPHREEVRREDKRGERLREEDKARLKDEKVRRAFNNFLPRRVATKFIDTVS